MPEPRDDNDNALHKMARAQAVSTASRSGTQTTEFKGKVSVQSLLLVVLVLNRAGAEIDLDEETAIVIIAGLEGAYALGRSIVKAFLVRNAS